MPEQALQTFEALSNLQVCVHDLCGDFAAYIDSNRSWHGGSFCRAVKKSAYMDRCYAFDYTELRKNLAQLIATNGRVHKCHAGLIEWVVPVHSGGQVLAILFAGQRRSQDWEPEVQAARSSYATPKAPLVSEEESVHYLEGLRQLAARLLQYQQNAHHLATEETRLHKIQHFIAHHHQEAVRIADLAEHLHVSPSRAAHVVREECGQSWSELLCQARLRTACDLLQHSDEGIVQIAMMSGFGDQSLFHKTFKRHFAVSPGVYRKDPENKL
ncbi:MAG: helix-turn-helix domain-containing protein [Planctomycetes bacterium]|nr:helix-turn-helix domain-containing protein [Planctomycetota bacterium]